jgi:polysaccharide export outer membrane protein
MIAKARIREGAARTALFLLGLLTLAACRTPQYPPAPRDAATPDYLYVIGPLDTVNIIVWRNPELSMSVPVRPDGRITTPLVEDLPALGKSSTALARDIEKALEKYIRDPVVTVIVTSFQGPYDQTIRVIGEAAKPQTLAYRQNMTLLDVMIAVGGLTDFANGNAATILRTADGGKVYGVKLRDLVKRGDYSANVDVKPGDILIIPQSWF